LDYDGVLEWATKNDAILTLDFRPGDFIVNGDHRVTVHLAKDRKSIREELDVYIISGSERTPTQDLEFSIRHLVEIALRALSPGINDPYTALAVIDRLRGSLARLMKCELPHNYLRDSLGAPRVWTKANSHTDLL